MATLNLDGWGNGWTPDEQEDLPIEVDPIDEMYETIQRLKYILKNTGQPFYLSQVEKIENQITQILGL